MASNGFCITIIFLLFLSPPMYEATARKFPYSGPSTTIYVDTKEGGGYVTMKPPHLHHRKELNYGREVKNCMPKGFRHSSAPSRYVNYHPLGSLPCLTGKHSEP